MKNELSNEQGVENFGVCAPKGFKINGLCERGEDGAEKGYTLLLSERRCSAAGVCAVSVKPTAPVYITKKHLASGYARGVFVNSGNALTYADNGEKLARNICSVVGQYAKISTDEILFCSTGRIGNSFDITDLESVLPSLVGGLGQDAIHEESAIKAFSSVFAWGLLSLSAGGNVQRRQARLPEHGDDLDFAYDGREYFS